MNTIKFCSLRRIVDSFLFKFFNIVLLGLILFICKRFFSINNLLYECIYIGVVIEILLYFLFSNIFFLSIIQFHSVEENIICTFFSRLLCKRFLKIIMLNFNIILVYLCYLESIKCVSIPVFEYKLFNWGGIGFEHYFVILNLNKIYFLSGGLNFLNFLEKYFFYRKSFDLSSGIEKRNRKVKKNIFLLLLKKNELYLS